jgi:hypothetical protein
MQQKYNYSDLREYPMMKSLLWVKEYLDKNGCDKHGLSAFNRFALLTAVFPYLRYNKYIGKKDVGFALQFYRNCGHLNLLAFYNRAIMASFKKSVFLGKIYVFMLNQISKLKKYRKIL